jgi:hypothetical protein
MADLRALAEKYIHLTGEVEQVRRAMLTALTANGAGGEPEPESKANFTRPARSPSGGIKPKPSSRSSAQSSHPLAIKAAKVDQEIVAMLRATPGLRTVEIAKATSAKTSTTVERLKRLRARGSVVSAEGGGWASAPSP